MILDAAAIGDPALGAAERILSQINDQLQEFKSWFHNAGEKQMREARQSNELAERIKVDLRLGGFP